MERWQIELCTKDFDKNFLADYKEIDSKFRELCNPIIQNSGKNVKFETKEEDDYCKSVALKVNYHNAYDLRICKDVIHMAYWKEWELDKEPRYVYSYRIEKEDNTLKEIYALESSKCHNMNPADFSKDIKKDFTFKIDYTTVINTLMNLAVTGKK